MFKAVDPKPDFSKLEQEVLSVWEDNKIFEKTLQNRKGKEPFVFFEGPPTANGIPGIHHVLARAFKDAVCRFQTMRGKYVLRKAGWDTHGLPVELQVEKELGISGKKQIENIEPSVFESIKKFNELCKKSVWQYKDEWEKMTKRMGFWIDLEKPYVTYDAKYIESVWALLKKIWDKGMIYEGHKVVPYCPRCGTALSSHEVAQGYDEATDTSVYVKFRIINKGELKTSIPEFILSWTTTPWTLPGNLALAVGEDIEYVKCKFEEEILIIAKERLILLEGAEVLETFKGKKLVGLEYEPILPGAIPTDKLNGKEFKVYTADFVTTDEGTGVVHTAVMYGEDDYILGEQIGLPKFHTVDEAGKFVASVPEVAGMFVKAEETEKKILDYIKGHNNLLKSEKHTHTYPFCWRCSTPLLYYARNSWYIKMSQLRGKLMKNNEEIKWEPEHIKEGRFGEWLREVKDWAISRERYWGTPLPFWRCEKCQTVKVVGSLSELGNTELDPHRPFIDEVPLKCDKCGGESRRVSEVLDVWFDSGAMPYAQWHYPFENKEKVEGKLLGLKRAEQFPANYIAEAIDQTRGWFYTLHAISTLLDFGPAYKSVICTGHILDAKGQKMSKSKGNVVDPWEMFNSVGADAVRWYFYTLNQPGENKNFVKDDVARVQRKTFTILWNILNYFATYANAEKWEYSEAAKKDAAESQNILDKWLQARLQALVNEVTRNTESLNITRATRSIDEFINNFSTWYLRRSRGRDDKEFFATTHKALYCLARLMAPFAPFFAENVYQAIKLPDSPDSVHLCNWPSTRDLASNEKELLQDMEQVRLAAELGNSIRKTSGLKVRQPLANIQVLKGDKEISWSENLKVILLDELNVKIFGKGQEVIWKEAGDFKVGLDKSITPELQFEGDVRELERAVQSLRKEAGLQVGEQALLYIEGDQKLVQALDKKRLSLSEIKNTKPENIAVQSTVELSSGQVNLGLEKVE